jgi:hypothetical protein
VEVWSLAVGAVNVLPCLLLTQACTSSPDTRWAGCALVSPGRFSQRGGTV